MEVTKQKEMEIMAWQIDPSHTRVQFSVRHMMISTVRGEFDKFSGTVEFDENNPAASTINVQIDAASLNTKFEQRDAHLRSADFFDVANHPYITFVSKRVEVIDPKHAKIYGDLTIRGVSKEVALDVEYYGLVKSPWGSSSAGFNAHTKINRKDWNLNWNVGLEAGGWLVGDDVTIDIEVELVQVPETVQAETSAQA